MIKIDGGLTNLGQVLSRPPIW